jgi:hypothetical protein
MQPIPTVLATALIAACAHSATSPGLSNSGQAPAQALAGTTLADDVAALTAMAVPGANPKVWPVRTTFLGWTAGHGAAYRALVCDPDALGGRGAYCELNVCVAPASTETPVPEPACTPAASFELGGDRAFDAADTTRAADAAVAALGPLTAGTPQTPSAIAIQVAAWSLAVAVPADAPARVVFTGDVDGATGTKAAVADQIVDGPGGCRAVIGVATILGEYEGVRGDLPAPFAVVSCAGR